MTLPKPTKPKGEKYEPRYRARRMMDGRLHDMLCDKFPEYLGEDGVLDVPLFARKMELTRQTVGRWLIEERITFAGAKALLRTFPKKLTSTDLAPYMVFGH